ncbi:thioredoxin domain-containing protein [Nannocystis sp. SCPEA4]|uniref:thioredoxin family protein n=1 Tax=Nannocystis sp. SCPEA4 TaxID=2996787 RepID=UPI00226D5A3D|nr:thioredoxin domain-containing protein [Nannocystis sp. SCPEA4]MCY1056842.1 thioredoxin domain-containing protein [Nannocystis sp. SCPEA4]
MPNPLVREFTDANFTAEVLESPMLTLVEFFATWNAPSRTVGQYTSKLATAFADRLKAGRLNIDDNQDTPQKYGIRSIPTTLLFKGGKVVEQIVGAPPYARFEAAVTKHL